MVKAPKKQPKRINSKLLAALDSTEKSFFSKHRISNNNREKIALPVKALPRLRDDTLKNEAIEKINTILNIVPNTSAPNKEK